MKKEKGITLIALVITIIILLILAGVGIVMLSGNNGILTKATKAKIEYEKSMIKEEIQLVISEIKIEEMQEGREVTLETLANGQLVNKLFEIEANLGNDEITGDYKGYDYIINDKFHVIIGEKTNENTSRITITYSLNTNEYTNQDVIVTINAITTSGTITKIEGPKDILKNADETYTITKNGSYQFTATDSNGTTKSISVLINHIDRLPPKDYTPIVNKNLRDKKITIIANAEDEDKTQENVKSGIIKYEYYIDNIKYESTDAQYEFTSLEEGKTYHIYVIAYDKAENSKKSETVQITMVADNINITNRKAYEADDFSGGNVPLNAINGSMVNGNGYNWYGGTKLLVEYNSVTTIGSMAVYTTNNWGYAFGEATIYYSEDDSLTLNSDLNQFKSVKIATESEQKLEQVVKAKRVMLVKEYGQAVYEFKAFESNEN